MTVPEAILAFEGVSAGYGQMTVLDRIDLRLARDEVLAVLGANGSGKSTLLKTAIGLTRQTAGHIRFDGVEIEALSPHRRAAMGIGYVPQTRNVFAALTVIENLRMGGFLHGGGTRQDIDGVFQLFPALKQRCHARAGTLSGGERRMLSIALTLLLRPRLLLLDEPSSDLSPAMVALVFEAIRRIRDEQRIPVLLVEQNVRTALALADRVCVLVRGRTALELPAAQLDLTHLHALFLEGSVRAASR
jgi:ABC-type branched-subunit amino acid transport system ATPase component